MSGRQSYAEEARRQQLNEANPPPPYSEAVNAVTPLPPHDGPTAPSHPTGPSRQATAPSSAQPERPVSLEWEIFALRRELELQRAERMCLGCGKALAEPTTQAGTVGSTEKPAHTLELTEGTESHEQKLIKMQVNTILTGWRTDKCMERIIQRRWERIKDKNEIIERKSDRVRSLATQLVAVQAELGRMKQREQAELASKEQPWEVEEPTYLGIIQSGATALLECVFEVARRLLGF